MDVAGQIGLTVYGDHAPAPHVGLSRDTRWDTEFVIGHVQHTQSVDLAYRLSLRLDTDSALQNAFLDLIFQMAGAIAPLFNCLVHISAGDHLMAVFAGPMAGLLDHFHHVYEASDQLLLVFRHSRAEFNDLGDGRPVERY